MTDFKKITLLLNSLSSNLMTTINAETRHTVYIYPARLSGTERGIDNTVAGLRHRERERDRARMKMMQEEEEDGGRNKVVMGKIKDSILLRLAAFNPSVSFNSAHASFIEDRLQQVFSSFNTPTHPPYPLVSLSLSLCSSPSLIMCFFCFWVFEIIFN